MIIARRHRYRPARSDTSCLAIAATVDGERPCRAMNPRNFNSSKPDRGLARGRARRPPRLPDRADGEAGDEAVEKEIVGGGDGARPSRARRRLIASIPSPIVLIC